MCNSRYLLLTTLLVITLNSHSQKIIENKIDSLAKRHIVRTDSLLVKGGLSSNMFIGFSAVDTTCFLNVSGNGKGADLISTKENIIFFLANDSKVIARSTRIQYYTEPEVPGKSYDHQYHSTDIQDFHIQQSGVSGDTYNHQYSISMNSVKILSQNRLKSIRKYGIGHYTDFDIKNKNSKKLSSLAKMFLLAIEVN